MHNVSLCILACNQVNSIDRLVRSVKEFAGLDVEVVIGDNSSSHQVRSALSLAADRWLPISDRELWFDGFGACKQRIVDVATNDLVIVADPDEEWFPAHHLELLAQGGSPQVYRTQLIVDGGEERQHGRVFNRKSFRLMGMLHEELYHRRTRKNWGVMADPRSFATVIHHDAEQDLLYKLRKQALYDNMLARIAMDPTISPGTASYWWREYWPTRSEGFVPMSFEEWSSSYGGENG